MVRDMFSYKQSIRASYKKEQINIKQLNLKQNLNKCLNKIIFCKINEIENLFLKVFVFICKQQRMIKTLQALNLLNSYTSNLIFPTWCTHYHFNYLIFSYMHTHTHREIKY